MLKFPLKESAHDLLLNHTEDWFLASVAGEVAAALAIARTRVASVVLSEDHNFLSLVITPGGTR
jgi:hypothetical protein